MQSPSSIRKTLTASAAAFVLGAASVGSVGAIALAQQSEAPQSQAPQEAKPKMMAPSQGFIQQLSFADLVEEVSPAVVSIRTEQEVQAQGRLGLPPEFEQMLPPEFRRFGQDDDDAPTRRAMGQGSGFFINDTGHIVTNNHVIEGADDITVVLASGEELQAELVGTDPSTDIAVLKVEPSPKQRFVRFAENPDLRVGDYVLAVGNPFGLGGSVTSGIVSAMGRDGGVYADFIQIDASINRGNSGGPTFDLRGNVVGVNTAIISPTGGNVGIGLAVPAEVASSIVDQLIAEGEVTRGWLGVGIGDLTPRLAAAVGREDAEGALIQSVQEGSPAERAGFREGDVVLNFDGKAIDSATSLTRLVGALPPGKKVSATVLRDGKEQKLAVTLDRRDPVEARAANEPAAPEAEEMTMKLGVTLSSLTEQTRERLGLEADVEGVLVADVDGRSEAAEAGFREGMVITRADNKPVKSPMDIEKAVKAAQARGKQAVLVRVQSSQRGAYFLALPVVADQG